MSTQIQKETARRRTFAIISHPDAGKTTITEKLLLYGGAKDLAGSVRGRKNDTDTSSDWLELEKKRGISVSSTVLQFEYDNYRINLLDTPGHRDFSEDTYRVLTAVDSAIMVIDVAKGIEEQTLKLFEVCRSRSIPIITFINKCDRPGKDPLALLDEIESRLGLQTFAANIPVGDGSDFVGIYDRLGRQFHHFQKVAGGRFRAPVEVRGLDDPRVREGVPARVLEHAVEVNEILEMAGSELDTAAVAAGTLSPVFFGSAVNNFGVQLLLDGFLRFASPPRSRPSLKGPVHPEREEFSSFVFKIQANMDPNHRDRLVFLRICSGKFERDQQVKHVQSGKTLRLSYSHQVFGRERDIQEEAWPGDILGITGRSGLEIGDTLTSANDIQYDPIPRFAPECFIRLRNSDTNAFKRFRRGIDQLLQEKVVQQFFQPELESREPLLGAVGPLQFDVVKFRLESEYGVDATIEQLPWTVTRWLEPDITEQDLRSRSLYGGIIVVDDHDRLCLLFDTEWSMNYFSRQNAALKLHKVPPGSASDFNLDFI